MKPEEMTIPRTYSFSLKDYLNLTKIRLTGLVAVTTLMGIYSTYHAMPVTQIFLALIMITLLVMGACTLNCYLERDIDLKMERTKDRPLPQKRIKKETALYLGTILTILPIIALAITINPLTAALGAISTILYVFFYTPLKQVSSYTVFLGAIPGALPPLMGQTAATGTIEYSGLALFALLFWWQIPHFMAISIRYSEDYWKGGIKTFPKTHGTPFSSYAMIVTAFLTSISGLLVPLVSSNLNITPAGSVLLTLLNGSFFLYTLKGLILRGHHEKLIKWARKVFFATIFYLPLYFALLVIFNA